MLTDYYWTPIVVNGYNCVMNNINKRRDIRDVKGLTLESLPELLTVRDAADFFRVAPMTIKRWIKKGKIKTIDIGIRDIRFSKSEIKRILDEGRVS